MLATQSAARHNFSADGTRQFFRCCFSARTDRNDGASPGYLSLAGVFTSIQPVNAMATNLDQGAPGIPYHVLLRSILNQRSLHDAEQTIRMASRASSTE